MLKPGWKVSGHSFSALEIARKSFVHSPPISWRLWITPVQAVDEFSGNDSPADCSEPRLRSERTLTLAFLGETVRFEASRGFGVQPASQPTINLTTPIPCRISDTLNPRLRFASGTMHCAERCLAHDHCRHRPPRDEEAGVGAMS